MGLDFVNTSFHSIYGEVRSHWKKEDGSFCWDISVPCNTSALVYVPVADKSIDPKEKKRIVGEGGLFSGWKVVMLSLVFLREVID